MAGSSGERWHLVAVDALADAGLDVTLVVLGSTVAVRLVIDTVDGRAVVVDDSVHAPPQGLELRAPGLWLDLSFAGAHSEQVTLAVEAFAVLVDDPRDIRADARGERLPVAVDIDWLSVDPPASSDATGLPVDSSVSGDLLVGERRISFEGAGWRSHHRE